MSDTLIIDYGTFTTKKILCSNSGIFELSEIPENFNYQNLFLGFTGDYRNNPEKVKTELLNYPKNIKYKILTQEEESKYESIAAKYTNIDFNILIGTGGGSIQIGQTLLSFGFKKFIDQYTFTNIDLLFSDCDIFYKTQFEQYPRIIAGKVLGIGSIWYLTNQNCELTFQETLFKITSRLNTIQENLESLFKETTNKIRAEYKTFLDSSYEFFISELQKLNITNDIDLTENLKHFYVTSELNNSFNCKKIIKSIYNNTTKVKPSIKKLLVNKKLEIDIKLKNILKEYKKNIPMVEISNLYMIKNLLHWLIGCESVNFQRTIKVDDKEFKICWAAGLWLNKME